MNAGARLTMLPRFDAAQGTVEQGQVTVFEGVPTTFGAVLAEYERDTERYDTSSLRLCVSGAASLPAELLHGFESLFGCAILEGFGMSETSPVASFNHPDRPRKPGSVGTPVEGVEVCILDPEDGVCELCVATT